MIPPNNQTNGMNPRRHRALKILRIATISTAALALGIIATASLRIPTADAHAAALDQGAEPARHAVSNAPLPPADHPDNSMRNAGSHSGSASGSSTTAINEIQPSQSDNPDAAVYVWSSALRVGKATDAINTYLGYMLGATAQGNRGSLTDTSFSYKDVHYTVKAIILQIGDRGYRELLFATDVRLPDDLILHIGDHRFALSDATISGVWSGRRTWRVDSNLGWRNGETEYLSLHEPFEG